MMMLKRALASGRLEDAFLYLLSLALVIGLSWYFVHANRQLAAHLLDPEAVTTFLDAESSASTTYYQLQTRVAGLRYRQAAYGIYGQETRRNAGFLVGSILVIVGALFVIRRLEITPFEADTAVSDQLRLQLRTSSPGLFLAGLGTLIVVVALVVPTKVDVEDKLAPDYGAVRPPGPPVESPRQINLGDLEIP